MDKPLNVIPKGKGTRIIGWIGTILGAGSLVADAAGVTVPAIQLGHDPAIQTLITSLIGLYLRRKLDG